MTKRQSREHYRFTQMKTESRLRQERHRRGWSLTRMTQETAINSSSLSLIERGLIAVYPGWQRRIARALGVPIEELFADKAALPVREAA